MEGEIEGVKGGGISGRGERGERGGRGDKIGGGKEGLNIRALYLINTQMKTAR